MITFDSKLTEIKGVGEKTDKLFRALDIDNVGALIYNFPRTYRTYPEVCKSLEDNVGTKAAIEMTLNGELSVKHSKRMDICLGQGIYHGTYVELIWFRMPYLKSQLHSRESYIFYGDVIKKGKDAFQLRQPLIFTAEKYNNLRKTYEPVYSLTRGLKNNAVKKTLEGAFKECDFISEFLPESIVKKHGFVSYDKALWDIHFPQDENVLTSARNRLVYNEFLKFFISIELEKKDAILETNDFVFNEFACFNKAKSKLPFELTKGQCETLDEVISSMDEKIATQRLIQGDVGSGKTIIAFLAMLHAVENGYQAAIMAPTEVLARQHEKTFNEYIDMFDLPFEVVCITGATKAAERRRLNEKISSENGLFIVGTHALVTDKMQYNNLALVITDEQHRFGVKQRKKLSGKGANVHVIVMSATPIPRTLAIILYSQMKISAIKDVPAKRLPIKNSVIRPNKRNAAWKFIDKQLSEGRQAYIICALVDDSEKSEAENVTNYAGEVKKYFKDKYAIGILHGKMHSKEKDDVMNAFLNNKIQILVSTTVIEVGINVPNASVMLIEDANRFGLAQLHQLRGRVGRGEWQSYCMFIDSSKDGEESKRLKILEKSNDGFYIAGEDLKLRGPGDFYGIRQSGDLNFKLADIYQDADIMKLASEDAKEIVSEDATLSSDRYSPLAEYIKDMDTVIYTNL